MDSEKRKAPAPYLAFKTFLSALDLLKAHGMPSKIDHTVFPSMSGMAKGQVLSAFKFLNLIDENGAARPELEELAENTDHRQQNIRKLIESRYADIVAIDLAKIAPSQLDAKLSGDAYAVTGETRKKAKTFLLKAAEFAGMPVSKLLTTKASGPRRKKNTAAKPAGDQQNGATGQGTPSGNTPPPPPPDGSTTIVQLKDGGSLTLSLAVNTLKLRGKDREFVFKIIDEIEDYESWKTQPQKDDAKSE
jgi:hypothetical protein